jgi:FkbM family methyltransferase
VIGHRTPRCKEPARCFAERNLLVHALARFVKATFGHELARSHRAAALLRFATLQIRTRLTGRPLLVPFVGATRIYVGVGCTGANGNYYWGLHEFADMAFVLHYLRREDLFIDVGANIGSYTLLASGAVGTRTIAFEPVPQTLTRLRANCEANDLYARVDIREVCAGASTGTVAFSTNADTMNSVVANGDRRPSIQVPMRRLDTEIQDPPILIKIDAEGSDDDVLAGATTLLCGQRPMALLIETLGGGTFGPDGDATAKRLAEFGFEHCSYDPRARAVEPTSTASANNYLFIRDVAFARARVASAERFDLNGFGTV